MHYTGKQREASPHFLQSFARALLSLRSTCASRLLSSTLGLGQQESAGLLVWVVCQLAGLWVELFEATHNLAQTARGVAAPLP